MITIIAAIGRNRELGKDNRLLWNIPIDLKRFKTLTDGKTIVMGRKTFESLPKVLSNRKHVVLTRKKEWSHPDVTVIHTIDEALKIKDIFVIGGSEIYEMFMPYADKFEITKIDADFDADVLFPEVDWTKLNRTFILSINYNGTRVDFETYCIRYK